MIFNWFLVINLTEFIDSGLVSKTVKAILSGIGQKNILVTRANEVSIVYEDVILPVDFTGDNPFVREGDDANYAVYKDDSNNIWLGIEAT